MTRKQRKALNKLTRKRPEWQATTRQKVKEHPALMNRHRAGLAWHGRETVVPRWRYRRLLRQLGHKLIAIDEKGNVYEVY